ncbi:hypothetical protein M231_06426 [Tremella mesenterica]|uniref:Uncharacterized protein n=1 Tax=Tremella mesenterica TaxID=5217 RepID=A0A4V1M3B5_TREME|nr:hypothetical protein M231_06426 [Tremella mesenterica]
MAPLSNVSRAFKSLIPSTSATTKPITAARTGRFLTLPSQRTDTRHTITPYTYQSTASPNDRGYQPSQLTTATRTPGNYSFTRPQTSQSPSRIITAAAPAFATARTEDVLDPPYEVDVGSYTFDSDPSVDAKNDLRRHKINTIATALGTDIEADQIRSWSQQLVDDAYDQVTQRPPNGMEATMRRWLGDEGELSSSVIADAIRNQEGVDLASSWPPQTHFSDSLSIYETPALDTSSSSTIRPSDTTRGNTVRKSQGRKLPVFDDKWPNTEAGPSKFRPPSTYGLPDPDLTEAEFAEWVSQMFPPPAHTDVDTGQSSSEDTTQWQTYDRKGKAPMVPQRRGNKSPELGRSGGVGMSGNVENGEEMIGDWGEVGRPWDYDALARSGYAPGYVEG